jgi:hypothetical protein
VLRSVQSSDSRQRHRGGPDAADAMSRDVAVGGRNPHGRCATPIFSPSASQPLRGRDAGPRPAQRASASARSVLQVPKGERRGRQDCYLPVNARVKLHQPAGAKMHHGRASAR